jgi:3-methyladenine DNA glycosylase/8-oxoguanine DNA glycosylase
MTRITVTVPRFHFAQLIHSHGWAWLAPFAWNESTKTLSRPITLGQGRHVPVAVRVQRAGSSNRVIVGCKETIQPVEREAIRKAVKRMLRLDDDFTEFHKVCATDPRLRFVARRRCGGMLRAPDLFEDLIKTVCTVNCSWGNTISMCEALCQFGEGAFPPAASLLAFNQRRLAARIPLGYRAKTVLKLARLYAEGRLPVDDWAAQGEFERIRETLRPVWGIGPYALNHILVLLGCYDAIPVDSEAIRFLSETHFGGKPVSHKEAVRPYDKYGKFRFLAFQFSRR